MKKTFNRYASIIMVLGLAFMQSINNILTPMVQDLIDLNPNVNVILIRGIVTIPPLLSLGLSIVISFFFKEKTRLKPLMIAAAALTLCGAIPMFFKGTPIALLFVTQMLVSCGAAFCMLRNAFVNRIFSNDKVASKVWIGRSQTMENVIPMIITPVAGVIASKNLRFTFVLYLLALLPLIMYLSYKEPKTAGAELSAENEDFMPEKSKPTKLNIKAALHILMIAFMTTITFPLMTAMSTFVVVRGIGGASAAGSLIGIYEAGNVVGCLLFEILTKKFEKFERSIAYGLLFIGFLFVAFAHSYMPVAIGMFVCGVGFIQLYLLHINYAGECSDADSKGFAYTVATASPQFGVFFSSFWISIIYNAAKPVIGSSSDAEWSFVVATVIAAIATACFVIADLRSKKKPDSLL